MISLKEILSEAVSSSRIKEKLEDFLKQIWDRKKYEDHFASDEFSYDEWFELYVRDEIKVYEDRVVFRFTSYNHFFDYSTYKSRRKVEEFFNDLVEDHGWYVSSVSLPDKANPGVSRIKILFERDKAEEVDPPKKLYHVTEADNLQSIKKRGLVPKEGDKFSSFLYPERIYLFTEKDKETIKRFIVNKMTMNISPEVMWGAGDFSVNPPKMALLEIDTSKLNGDIKFYKDFDLKKSVWTDEKIPFKAIEVVDYYYNTD